MKSAINQEFEVKAQMGGLLVLVKKKCYVMLDRQEMMKKKFYSDNFQLIELKN